MLGLSRCPLCLDQAWLFLGVPVSSQPLASFPRVSLIAHGRKVGVVGMGGRGVRAVLGLGAWRGPGPEGRRFGSRVLFSLGGPPVPP